MLAETTIYDLNGDMIFSLVSCIDAKKQIYFPFVICCFCVVAFSLQSN